MIGFWLNMKLIIPKLPLELQLTINNSWSGELCSDERVYAHVSLGMNRSGMLIRAQAPILDSPLIPDAPVGSRVEKLWTYDVVEVFFVGPGHCYVEVELGAGGHYLVLGFDSIRNL